MKPYDRAPLEVPADLEPVRLRVRASWVSFGFRVCGIFGALEVNHLNLNVFFGCLDLCDLCASPKATGT